MTAIARRPNVEEIVARRNAALERYADAFDAIARANDAMASAREARRAASPRADESYNHLTKDQLVNYLDNVMTMPDRDAFLARARHLVDVDVWASVVAMTDLQTIMDREAKNALRRELADNPPEVTVENVAATVETWLANAETVFQRGIANVFANLDRRFRSHDGWKIGSRIILQRMFGDMGNWNYFSDQRDALRDVERAFRMLDDTLPPAERRLPPDYAGAVGAIEAERAGWPFGGPRQSYVETDYFRIRIFQNGNAHLWFTRQDLVRKVNKLLAAYYGEVIPDERGPDDPDPFEHVKRTPAKRYGFFPTPDRAAGEVIHKAALHRRDEDQPLTVLEPSAGTGNLARLAAEGERHPHIDRWERQPATVDVVELHPHLADGLRSAGIYRRVIEADFLGLPPRPEYDRVIMNPPFDLERDIDHVMHARKFLRPGGRLIAIMSAGTEFRETRKAKAFRAEMKRLNARWTDLPPGSFAEVGTYVNTVIVAFQEDGRPPW